MDACFSIWRARFGSTYAWAYQFEALAAHHRVYRLMARWHAALPVAILDVAYEELVCAPAATLRRVLDFCGLAWEAGCEALARNATPVSTLSSAQVRRPLDASAVGNGAVMPGSWSRCGHGFNWIELAGFACAPVPGARRGRRRRSPTHVRAWRFAGWRRPARSRWPGSLRSGCRFHALGWDTTAGCAACRESRRTWPAPCP